MKGNDIKSPDLRQTHESNRPPAQPLNAIPTVSTVAYGFKAARDHRAESQIRHMGMIVHHVKRNQTAPARIDWQPHRPNGQNRQTNTGGNTVVGHVLFSQSVFLCHYRILTPMLGAPDNVSTVIL